MLNSLKYAKILEESGMPREQAETHVQILAEILGGSMATKEDLKILSLSFNKDLNGLSLSVDKGASDLSMSFNKDLNDMSLVFKKEVSDLSMSFNKNLNDMSLAFNKDLKSLSLSLHDLSISSDKKFNAINTELNGIKKELQYLSKNLRGMESRLHDKIIIKLGTLMTVLFGSTVAIASLILS